MLTGQYQKDYYKSRVIAQGKQVEGYDKVYYETTEDLTPLLALDFQDKKVLSVLASSDPVFTARLLEAKRVDSFDKNRLTLYYYFLRKWSIKYMHELLPNIFSVKWMWTCIKSVKPNSPMEHHALMYFLNHLKERTNIENLFYDIDKQPEGQVIYEDVEDLLPTIDHKLSFYNFDLFEPIPEYKHYDSAIILNVLDWARNDRTKLERARDNLKVLLNPNGEVYCSNIVTRDLSMEEEIFSSAFEKENISDSKSYVYRLK